MSEIRLTHSHQKGTWVVEQFQSLLDDRTYSHRSIGRTCPGRISAPGTTVSPLGSPPGKRSKRPARKAESPSGYKMLEQAKARGNARDRGSRFALRRKAADFRLASHDRTKEEGTKLTCKIESLRTSERQDLRTTKHLDKTQSWTGTLLTGPPSTNGFRT